ncbi:hypothetical protein FF1_003848 [Malus domestica]
MSPMHQVGNSVAESRILSGPFTAPVAIKQLSQGFPIAAPDPRQLGRTVGKRAHGEVEGRTRKRQKNINTEQPATPTQRFPPFSVLNSHIQQTDGHPRLTQPAQSSPSLAGFLCQPQQSGGDSEPDTRITARTSQNVIMAEYSNNHIDQISHGTGPKILPRETQAGIYNNTASHEES